MIPIMLHRLRIRRRLYSKRAPDCGKIFCKIAGEKTLIDLYGKWCAQIQQINISFPDFLSWCLQIWRNTNSITGNIIIISAQRVGFFNIVSGRVLDKIPGIGSSSGRVGVSKYTIGYFRVSFLLSGISGYFGYFRVSWVFSGISGFTHIYQGYFLTLMRAEKIATKPN